ncbi:MAG: hypothetical protein QNM02_20105 [Acidimicrobiia bacterium]|nr:hypothetical protein [Acidimicrobiia bacterium]
MPNGQPNSLIPWGDGIVSHIDRFATSVAEAGVNDISEQLRFEAILDRRDYKTSFTIDKVPAKIEAGIGSR